MENASVLNANGSINKDSSAVETLWPNSADIIDDCVNAQAGLFDSGMFVYGNYTTM